MTGGVSEFSTTLENRLQSFQEGSDYYTYDEVSGRSRKKHYVVCSERLANDLAKVDWGNLKGFREIEVGEETINGPADDRDKLRIEFEKRKKEVDLSSGVYRSSWKFDKDGLVDKEESYFSNNPAQSDNANVPVSGNTSSEIKKHCSNCKEEVKKSIREVEEGKRSKISYQSHACGRGEYNTETLEYDRDGNYSYRERIERPNRQVRMVQSSSHECVNICTKPIQTVSSVEYKRPPSPPCKIM
ncbi:13093_t:CDS:2 [Ambispora leptoticha]|uniref:13093_t:CDS:1 n=1 Tax=Ambispora leptoticha TaxID=144679 RepID=A0A9N9N452_9GLOM|nr:13093_t:CDS:2 [Ambispora leptoticha]